MANAPTTTQASGKVVEYEMYIDQQIAKTSSHVRVVDVATGLLELGLIVLSSLLALVIIDHWIVGLAFWARLLALVGLVGYAGRVRSEQVDEGQFASRGVALAKLYAVDYAEVRLPLPDRDLAYLDLMLARRTRASDALSESSGPAVVLRAEFAGKQHAWTGRIVRTEGELDPKSRMVQVVARVEDPYGAAAGDDRPPLAVGLFVEAEIEGRVVEGVFVLPSSALRHGRSQEGGHRVLVVDADSRLRFREVDVLRKEHGRVIVGGGLVAGERVCISSLRAVTDGMRVRVAEDPDRNPELAGVAS